MPNHTLVTLIEESHNRFAELSIERVHLARIEREALDEDSTLVKTQRSIVLNAEIKAQEAKKALLEYLGLA